MEKRHFGLFLAAGAVACATGPELHRPVLDDVFTRDMSPPGILALRQRVELAGSALRVCNRVRNVSSREVVVGKVLPTEDGYSRFGTHFFGPNGVQLIDHLRNWPQHPHPPPPPPPMSEEDETPYDIIPPGGELENCGEINLPEGASTFTVLSTYHSWQSSDQVPRRLRENRTLFMNERRVLHSNICFVYLERREIRCEE